MYLKGIIIIRLNFRDASLTLWWLIVYEQYKWTYTSRERISQNLFEIDANC